MKILLESLTSVIFRFGQMLQASRTANTWIDQDLVLLINQLPYNRLINIILSNLTWCISDKMF